MKRCPFCLCEMNREHGSFMYQNLIYYFICNCGKTTILDRRLSWKLSLSNYGAGNVTVQENNSS